MPTSMWSSYQPTGLLCDYLAELGVRSPLRTESKRAEIDFQTSGSRSASGDSRLNSPVTRVQVLGRVTKCGGRLPRRSVRRQSPRGVPHADPRDTDSGAGSQIRGNARPMAINQLTDGEFIDGPRKPLPAGRPAPASTHPMAVSAVGVTEVEDLALIAGIAANDLAALAALYDRYRSAAFGLAVRITRDRSLAEDVVQEAFLGVWRGAARYDARRGGSRTWILTIVHHRAVDVIRKRRRISELPIPESASQSSFVVPDIWSEVAGRLDRDTIVAALATLGTAQREAIELAYFSGLTQAEIARHTGAPLGTVKSRVRLGLLALRDAVAPTTTSSR